MATKTTNYKLIKPAQTDYYDVDVFNSNADTIDGALYGLFDDLTDSMNRLDSIEGTFYSKTGGKIYGNIDIEGSIILGNQKIMEDNGSINVTSKLSVNGKNAYDDSRIMTRVKGVDDNLEEGISPLSKGNIVLFIEPLEETE